MKKRLHLPTKFHFSNRVRPFATREALERDWKIISVSFLTLLVLVAVFSLYMYTRVSARDIFTASGSEAAKEATVLDRDELENALEVTEEKRRTYDRVRSNPLVLPDPS